MKKTKKNKGFTLVELLVVVVILGIITLMAIPQISNLIDSNNDAKYETYTETVKTGGKLYTDAYSIDMFGNNTSGCYDISYDDLSNKDLVQDININNVTCSGGTQKKTFVRVYKSGNHYKYKVSILCTNKNDESTIEYSSLISEDLESDTVFCDGKTVDADGPTISLDQNGSDWTTGEGMKVRVTISDDYGLLENIKVRYVWTTTPTSISDSQWKTKNFSNARYDTSVSFELNVPQNKNADYYLVVDPVMVRDANGNYQTSRFISNVFKFDNTAPSCTIAATTTPTGLDSWYVVEPTIKLTYTDERGEVVAYGMDKTNKDNDKLDWNSKKTRTQSDTTGVTWYGYIKDGAGNIAKCNTSTIKVDTVAPTIPTSGKLSISGTSSNATLAKASGSTDATSDIKEYRYFVLKDDSTKPENTAAGFTTTRSFVRECGKTYYAYAIAVDNAGNKSAVYSMGTASDAANSYSDWSSCSKECGTGTRTRTNTCAIVTEGLEEACNTDTCCTASTIKYKDGSSCSGACGTGTKNRLAYSTYASDYSIRCSEFDQSSGGSSCNTGIDCCTSSTIKYQDGTSCSGACGTGTKNRLAYSTYASDYSIRCSAYDKSSGGSSCNTGISCCTSSTIKYKDGSSCSGACGTGTKNRLAYSTYASDYSIRCSAYDKSSGGSSCNTGISCCTSSTVKYKDGSSCSGTCGTGTKNQLAYSTYASDYSIRCSAYDRTSGGSSCDTGVSCCTIVYHTSASSRCWTFAANYMGGGANWSNGKLQLCTGNDTGCVSATESGCNKIGGTYFYFKYCP